MTFVGKIFIVLQLVLSICFMAWAGAVYTAETNWREKAENLEQQNADKQAALTEADQALQKLKSDTETQVNTLGDEVDLLTSQLTAKTGQLTNAEKGLEEARTAVDQQTALANIAQEQAAARREETLRQRERNTRLQSQINDLLAQVRTLEDTVFEKETSIANMQKRHNKVLADLGNLRDILLSQNMSLDPNDYEGLATAAEPPPGVIGQVLETQVSPSTGTEFVAISLGSDDGFRKGHELIVYRGSDYLGKIKLTTVEADRSVGHLIPNTRPRNGAIQKGDNVRPQTNSI